MIFSRQLLILTFLLLGSFMASAFTSTPTGLRNDQTALMAKKRRGGFGKDLAESGTSNVVGKSKGAAQRNWLSLKTSTKELPSKDGEIGLLDTNSYRLMDKATNPTGAVSVGRYGGAMYCFSASCPSCKIPLKKSGKLKAGPTVSCSFCKASYNLRTGERLSNDEEEGGIFGGLVKNVLSANADSQGPLPTYTLGEKNGKVLISFD